MRILDYITKLKIPVEKFYIYFPASVLGSGFFLHWRIFIHLQENIS